MTFFAAWFHFVGDEDIGAIDVVPDYFCAKDSADDVSRVYPDSHIEILEVDDVPDFPDLLYHEVPELEHILSFFGRVSLGGLEEAHHNVAVSDGVELIGSLLLAYLIELGEEVPEHVDHFVRRNFARILSEASNVGEE